MCKKNIFSVVILVWLLLILVLTGCYKATKEEKQVHRTEETSKTEEAISKDYLLKSFDDLCKEIPAIRDFRLVSKHYGTHTRFVSHIYSSMNNNKIDYWELRDFYLNYFQNNGWKTIADDNSTAKFIEFEKNGNYVMVSKTPSMVTSYSISCDDTPFK